MKGRHLSTSAKIALVILILLVILWTWKMHPAFASYGPEITIAEPEVDWLWLTEMNDRLRQGKVLWPVFTMCEIRWEQNGRPIVTMVFWRMGLGFVSITCGGE